ncbi:MAG: ImmA/IrrE family metallo-endopeptidase [Actinomycetota bacterium]
MDEHSQEIQEHEESDDLTDIEKKAWRILEDSGVKRPPVPVEVVARELGAELVFEPFEGGGISGMLFRDRDNSRNVIGVNSAHPQTRQRFTVAHELGHLLLGDGRKRTVLDRELRVDFRDQVSSTASSAEEIKANSFAAALLMPRTWVEEEFWRLAESGPDRRGDELVLELAIKFKVSPQAMDIRLANLGLRSLP